MCSCSFLIDDVLESYRSGENLIPLLHSSVRKIVPETRAKRSFWNHNLTHAKKSRGTDYTSCRRELDASEARDPWGRPGCFDMSVDCSGCCRAASRRRRTWACRRWPAAAAGLPGWARPSTGRGWAGRAGSPGRGRWRPVEVEISNICTNYVTNLAIDILMIQCSRVIGLNLQALKMCEMVR